MTLPIVIIFERHWDTIPKLVVKDLLPQLEEKGYNTLCLETPDHLTSKEIIVGHQKLLEEDTQLHQEAAHLLKQVNIIQELTSMNFGRLSELLHYYVSSKRYVELAEKIKSLPASQAMKDIFTKLTDHSFTVKGVDSKALIEIVSESLVSRRAVIEKAEERRINTIFKNLITLQNQQAGVIFICGALHADRLIEKFKQSNKEEGVLHYFIHSNFCYFEEVDDVKLHLNENKTLEGHTHLLLEQDVQPFAHRIANDVTPKIKYLEQILRNNSHIDFLSRFFKTSFQGFLRPGYFLDALIDEDIPLIEEIKVKIHKTGLPTHFTLLEGKRYFVIPNVNKKENADKLRLILYA